MIARKLTKSFFEQPTLKVAENLLDKFLVVQREGKRVAGKIVETEAYIGEDDLACHASKGRTNRSEILYRKAGTVYVYLVYGMYYCLNIVTERENFPSAVLIRAIEPIEGIDLMKKRRNTNISRNLASGPGKLCMAFGINKKLNGENVFGKDIWIEDRGEDESPKNIISAPRVGVDYAKHCKNLPWRFYIKDNQFISRK